MNLPLDSNPQSIIDQHFKLKCPYCLATSSVTAISTPRADLVRRFALDRIGIYYRCDACSRPIPLEFQIQRNGNPMLIADNFDEVVRAAESFEFQYLPADVAADFREALTCYSNSCWNAFGAMSRRALQSAATELGAEGSAKVQNQLADLKSMGVVDETAHEQLAAVMLAGHDGAHPHLPSLDAGRAAVLLELMKDVLYQLFVRQAKIKEAAELRAKAIAAKRAT